MASVNLPDCLTSIGDSAFHGCSALTSVTIPNSVDSLGKEAFAGCRQLEQVKLPKTLTAIPEGLFDYCSALKTVELPDGVTQIGRQAFYNCVSLTTVSGMDGVVSIGDHSFCNCVSLSQITVPAGVTSVGTMAFYNCDALADENDFGVMITYGAYFTHRVGTIYNPTYKMQPNCGTDAMDKQGMQSDGIMDEFQENASITKIEVYNSEGTELCDTVFVIGDEHLIYYGTGNYVFCAVKLDAVG